MKFISKDYLANTLSKFFENFTKLFGRESGLATLNSEGKIPVKQIDDSVFNDHIEYVDTVPTKNIKNKIYAVPHSYTTNENKETNTLDIIGSYTRLQSNGKYVVDSNVVLALGEDEIGSMFVSGSTVNLYTGRDFTGLLARTVTTSAINVWNVKQTVNHKDYYCGNEEEQTLTKMANVDQVEDWFIRKEEKGTAGGVAVLNADGKIPLDELSFNTLIFLGVSADLENDIANIAEPTSGMFFISNAEQTYNEESYYSGDWCIYDGTVWEKSANTNIVTSVNGKIGNVIIDGDDIPVSYEGETDTLNNTLIKLGGTAPMDKSDIDELFPELQWVEKTDWKTIQLDGSYIWEWDGHLYYSDYGEINLELINGSWYEKEWTGSALFNFQGKNVWKFNGHCYYSDGYNHFELIDGAWIIKMDWGSSPFIEGVNVWTYNGHCYNSNGTSHYELINGLWVQKTWTGLTDFQGRDVWQHNGHCYYSDNTSNSSNNNYELINGNWVKKNWAGNAENLSGQCIWTYHDHVYSDRYNYIYNNRSELVNGVWVSRKLAAPAFDANGYYIWQFNGHCYYSDGSKQYELIGGDL